MKGPRADVGLDHLNGRKVRIGDLRGWRSERPQSALPVEICEAQRRLGKKRAPINGAQLGTVHDRTSLKSYFLVTIR